MTISICPHCKGVIIPDGNRYIVDEMDTCSLVCWHEFPGKEKLVVTRFFLEHEPFIQIMQFHAPGHA